MITVATIFALMVFTAVAYAVGVGVLESRRLTRARRDGEI